MENLKPIGFIIDNQNPNNSIGVYFKDEVLDFLLLKSNNDQEEANKMFNEYWNKNKKVLLIIKSDYGKEYQENKINDEVMNNIILMQEKLKEYNNL